VRRPLGVRTHSRSHRFNAASKLEGHLVRPPPSIPPPLLLTESTRGPFMRRSGGMSVRSNNRSEVRGRKMGLCVCAYSLCLYIGVCVCVSVSVCKWAKWPGLSWGRQTDSARGDSTPLSRPLFFLLFLPLAEPQFEPQRVHSVQVVSEQPLVSDKTQVLVQLQGRLVGDFGLQYNLGRDRRTRSARCSTTPEDRLDRATRRQRCIWTQTVCFEF